MHERHLAGLDLNLLLALDVLLEEGSVTRGAARLGRTQPAVSRMLGRLREVLGDPLLVRDGGRMRRTPRGEALREPLGRVLSAIETEVLAADAFDPATARRTFTIASADFAEATLLPPALARIAQEGPGIDVVLDRADLGPQPLSDRVDLLLAPLYQAPGALRALRMGDEPFACLVGEGHPAEVLDLDSYVGFPHVLVAPRGTPGGIVDDLLARQGLSRRVAVRTRSFLAAPRLLPGTDRILTLPRRTAELAAAHLPLRLLAPPFAIPAFTLHLTWHERWSADPGHRWLRRVVAETVSPLLDPVA